MPEKISKQAAGYVHFEKTEYQCEECYKFEPNHGKRDCAEVEGIIKAIGGCNNFVRRGHHQGRPSQIIAISIPRKLSQLEAGYGENRAGFSCKRCEYFSRDKWDCKKVDRESKGPDDGVIHPEGCCNLWEKSPIFGEIA